ncbi:GNAT family N-acetyltransferase [Nocardioides koreensis]|uniref:GNAT family N-acetyltransferase n=1 Tax=Nocardioides koreensis TaxID=433651 RepID=A0ABN3A0N2_9ACTN
MEFAPDDDAAVRDYVTVANAARAVDSPFEHPMTEREAAGILRYGWDLDPALPYLLRVDGEAVALGEYDVSRRDNFHLAWLTVQVHPERRRRGHGSALLDALVARARAEGRTSVGTAGWESEATTGFAARHGFELKQVEVARRQVVAEVDWPRLDKLYDEALPLAAAYELVRRAGMTPEQDLEAVATMVAAINDAPTGGLDIEDEVFTPQRVRDYHEAQRGCGHRVRFVYARHRATGELAGQTTVAVDGERPHLAEQHDTSVVRAHRGHRLGLLMKIEMLRWLREDEPQLESIDTWNAEENAFMIDVNEALGLRVLGRGLAFQRSI